MGPRVSTGPLGAVRNSAEDSNSHSPATRLKAVLRDLAKYRVRLLQTPSNEFTESAEAARASLPTAEHSRLEKIAKNLVDKYTDGAIAEIMDLIRALCEHPDTPPSSRGSSAGSSMSPGQKRSADDAYLILQHAENSPPSKRASSRDRGTSPQVPASDDQTPSPTQADWPPPLQTIQSRELKDQVFTHKSFLRNIQHSQKHRLHNERLEFKGDALLNHVVTDLLYELLPDASEGDLTIQRSTLVSNSFLWELTVEYHLDELLKTDATGRINKNGPRSKAYADVFEAYVGALHEESGYEETRAWLRRLYAPLIKSNFNDSAPVDKSAKNTLYKLVGSSTQRPEYNVLLRGPVYTVSCNLNGQVLGLGRGRSIRDAGLRAAANALEDKQTLETISRKGH